MTPRAPCRPSAPASGRRTGASPRCGSARAAAARQPPARPDPRQPQAGRNLVPPLDRLLADPLNETKNSPNVHYIFPDCRNESYGAASRLTELPPTSGTRIFDKPSPKRGCRSGMHSRFNCALRFVRACNGGALGATIYRDDQRLCRGQVHVTRWTQYDHCFLHA